MPSRLTVSRSKSNSIMHHRFLAHHPAVVTGVDGDDLRRPVLDDAAVRILDVDLAVHEETDVRVHAEVGADHGFHVHRPAEAGWVHHALHPGGSGLADLEQDVTDLAPFGALRPARRSRSGAVPRRPSGQPSLRLCVARLSSRPYVGRRASPSYVARSLGGLREAAFFADRRAAGRALLFLAMTPR